METLSCCSHVFPLGKVGVREGTLFPLTTPCFSLVPRLSQSSSHVHVHVSGPLGEALARARQAGLQYPGGSRFFLNVVLEVARDRDSGEGQEAAACSHPRSSSKPWLEQGGRRCLGHTQWPGLTHKPWPLQIVFLFLQKMWS